VIGFVTDCVEDRLPTVSIIDPPFSVADDHPSHDPRLGQKFVGLIVDALTNSESWETSALLILYDEGLTKELKWITTLSWQLVQKTGSR
jgi:phospholipase C